jgi:hypothetical protein
MRGIIACGALALLAACNSNIEATERARNDQLAQSICGQRGILPGDSRYDACRASLTSRSLVDTSGALTSDGTVPPTGDVPMNPYSSRPTRGVYGSGI